MAKQVIFDDNARRSLKRGIDRLSDAVRVTIGPKGRNVVLDKKFGSPTITNDGVTIARDIELEDPFENMGAQLLKEVATRYVQTFLPEAQKAAYCSLLLQNALIELGTHKGNEAIAALLADYYAASRTKSQAEVTTKRLRPVILGALEAAGAKRGLGGNHVAKVLLQHREILDEDLIPAPIRRAATIPKTVEILKVDPIKVAPAPQLLSSP